MGSMTCQGGGGRQGALPLRGRLLRLSVVVPCAAMLVGLAALVSYCRSLLQDAAAGREVVVGEWGFWLSVGGFLAMSMAVFLLQVVRLANRVAGPEHRLQRSLQRIRSGDLGFRITLRRGDLLTGLAKECNELIEWLNVNPPAGARTGGDVVEIEALEPGKGKP